jgi:hypothetical protein
MFRINAECGWALLVMSGKSRSNPFLAVQNKYLCFGCLLWAMMTGAGRV